MKRKLSKIILFCAVAGMSMSSVAATGYASSISLLEMPENLSEKVINVSGINYIITVTPTSKFNGRAVVANNKDCTLSNVTIPNVISYNGANYNVVEISDKAFFQNNTIKSVTISSAVEKIDSDAFVACNNLEQINIEKGSTSYRSEEGVLYTADRSELLCVPIGKKLETFSVPASVKKIDECAFYGNDKLYSIFLPTELKEIGDYAFTDCYALSKISTINKIEKIGKYAFAQTKLSAIGLPSTLKEIGEGAFIGTELRSIKIPSSIEIIPDWVFYNCENLKTVTIGENVTVIGDGAFNETAIEELKLPDKTMKVGYVAFADCTKLKNVKLANVKEIGNEAFVNCKELINFTITKNVQEIGEGVFIGCDSLQNISVEAGNQKFTDIGGILYDKGMTKLIKYPACNYNSSYELPSNIRVIVDGALDGCRFISEYTVADGSMWFSAEDGVLYDFDKNTLVDYPIAKNAMNFSIPDRIRKIEKSAFEDCLISGCINISANVTEIGDDAFAGCKKVNLYTVHKDNKNFKAVDGVLFSIDGTRILQYPLASAAASYTIPEDVTTVGTSAFRYSKLTEIKMGSNVKEIKKEAFRDTVITEMILPEGLVSIGESAFDTCELLKITIPESVNNISDLAFASCPRLYEIEFKSKKGIDSVGLDVFDSTNNIQNVYVPVGSTQRYKNMFIEMGLADYDEIVGER